MDGTLVNTEPVGPQIFNDLFKKYNVGLTEAEKELFVKVWRREGTDIKEEDYLIELVRKYGIDAPPTDFVQEFYQTYKSEIIKAEQLPGATSFLELAARNNKKLALVTSSKREQAEAILSFHKWRELFTDIVSEEDITNFKPNPEPYLLAAKKLKIDPSDCLVFEDATNGVSAGKAANMYVTGLRAGNKTEQDLSNSDLIVYSFNDLTV